MLSRREERKKRLAPYIKQKQASKMYAVFLFGSCTVIEIATLVATFMQLHLAELAISFGYAYEPQLTPLVTLIGTVISEVIAYAVYVVRAKGEDTIRLENMKMQESCKGPEDL